MDYLALAKRVVQRALKRGARQAEAFIGVGRTASCEVRDGAIEGLTQATSKGIGLRVFAKNRLGFSFSSDFEAQGLNGFVDRAIALAKETSPDPHHGLPTRQDLAKGPPLDGLFDRAVAELPSDWKVKAALEMERSAKAFDPRVKTLQSVGAGESVGDVYLASSEGFADAYSGTYAYLYAVPVATDGTQLQTGYWVDYRRFLDELEAPEAVGRHAARRAVRMLGARKVATQRVPVVFDPLIAASFVGSLAAAANGDAVFKRSSLFAPLLGKPVASPLVTVVDDGRLPRGIASAPFDGEGVATRRTPIIDRGLLTSFLYDTYTARKAKTRATGSAARSYRSLPGIGTHNLFLEPGGRSPEDIVKEVKSGFYVTSMLGHGANIVTGDYSRGANGLWIEGGELAYPVQEVTVAGNLLEMLGSVDAVGDDLVFRGTVGAPTMRFGELTVSGA